MKITKVEVLRVKTNRPSWRPIFCRIHTDEGIYGDGEAAMAYDAGAPAAYAMIKDLAPTLIGMDPMQIEWIWETFFRTTFWGLNAGPVMYSAMSAIDIALWDIKGKALGVPVYQLLGGKCNQRIRTYASQVQFGWGPVKLYLNDPADYAQAVRDAAAQGYTAVKVDPIGVTDQGVWIRAGGDDTWKLRGVMPNKVLDLACARVAAMREAGGRDLDIIIENHAFTDSNTAIQLARALEPYGIYFMEEAVHPLNSRSMRFIRENIHIPLAAGERIFTRWGYRPFLEDRSLQVLQPDFCLVGGITEGKKVADLANLYDCTIQGHCCGGPISTAAALQVEAAIPNFIIHELHSGALKEQIRSLCKYDHMPENGYYRVPELPGIGQELSEEAMSRADHIEVRG